jgi:hypothetical protein
LETVIKDGRDLTPAVLEQTTFTSPSLMKGRKLLNDAKLLYYVLEKHWVLCISFVGNEFQYKSGVSPEVVKETIYFLSYIS